MNTNEGCIVSSSGAAGRSNVSMLEFVPKVEATNLELNNIKDDHCKSIPGSFNAILFSDPSNRCAFKHVKISGRLVVAMNGSEPVLYHLPVADDVGLNARSTYEKQSSLPVIFPVRDFVGCEMVPNYVPEKSVDTTKNMSVDSSENLFADNDSVSDDVNDSIKKELSSRWFKAQSKAAQTQLSTPYHVINSASGKNISGDVYQSVEKSFNKKKGIGSYKNKQQKKPEWMTLFDEKLSRGHCLFSDNDYVGAEKICKELMEWRSASNYSWCRNKKNEIYKKEKLVICLCRALLMQNSTSKEYEAESLLVNEYRLIRASKFKYVQDDLGRTNIGYGMVEKAVPYWDNLDISLTVLKVWLMIGRTILFKDMLFKICQNFRIKKLGEMCRYKNDEEFFIFPCFERKFDTLVVDLLVLMGEYVKAKQRIVNMIKGKKIDCLEKYQNESIEDRIVLAHCALISNNPYFLGMFLKMRDYDLVKNMLIELIINLKKDEASLEDIQSLVVYCSHKRINHSLIRYLQSQCKIKEFMQVLASSKRATDGFENVKGNDIDVLEAMCVKCSYNLMSVECLSDLGFYDKAFDLMVKIMSKYRERVGDNFKLLMNDGENLLACGQENVDLEMAKLLIVNHFKEFKVFMDNSKSKYGGGCKLVIKLLEVLSRKEQITMFNKVIYEYLTETERLNPGVLLVESEMKMHEGLYLTKLESDKALCFYEALKLINMAIDGNLEYEKPCRLFIQKALCLKKIGRPKDEYEFIIYNKYED